LVLYHLQSLLNRRKKNWYNFVKITRKIAQTALFPY
jgi:hypothetical protein